MTSSGSALRLPAERTAEAFTRALHLLAPETGPVAIAVSGGSDSLATLILAHEWAQAARRPLIAATVDHGLRPEAAREAETVAVICAKLAIAHTTLRWRPTDSASQADARAARHRLLADWATSRSASAIALGHTEDDRIETFLIRARAGSDWRGLAGPMPRASSPAWPEGAGVSLIRPALALSREALRDSLRRRGHTWIEDPSNALDRYERVRMRRLAGQLAAPTRQSIVASMNRLARLRAAVAAGAREALGHAEPDAPALRLDAASLGALPAEVRRRLVEALVLAAGGAAGPLKTDGLDRLLAALASGDFRSQTLAGAHLSRKGSTLNLRQAPPRRGQPPAPGFAQDFESATARVGRLLADPMLAALEFRG